MNSLQWFGIIAIIMGIGTLTIPFVVPPQSSQFDYTIGVIPTTITPNYEIFPITYWASGFTFIFIGLMVFLINTFSNIEVDGIDSNQNMVRGKKIPLQEATLDELVTEISRREGVAKCSWGDDRGILVILPKYTPLPPPNLTSSVTPDDIIDSELFMEEQEGRLK